MESPLRNRLGRLSRLVRKELSEILRDRRTIVTLVLMPLLVYPLLAVAFQQYFVAHSLAAQLEESYALGFSSGDALEIFHGLYEIGDKQLRDGDISAYKVRADIKVHVFDDREDLEQGVAAGKVELGLDLTKRDKIAKDREMVFEAIYKSDSARAQELLTLIERRLAAANGALLKSFLGAPGRQRGVYAHLTLKPLAPAESKRVSLAALIPLILILMTITGAVYPAIDLTAGERERGTLEILVAAPVPRLGLLFAKYVSVLTVAILTALVNLLTMLVTLLLSGLGSVLFAGMGLSVFTVLQLLGLLVLFAAFFSAVLLTLTSFARSFKEAQAYLIPLMLLSLAPGVMGMLPGLRLDSLMSVVPLVNIVLLSRDLFERTANPAVAVVVVLSTLLYALAAIATAARIFGAEGVLYSEQSAWSDLWRRPPEPRAVPSVASALMCLALMFPVWFVLQGLIRQFEGISVLGRIGLLAFISILLFGGFPLLSAYVTRVRVSSGFQLRAAPVPAFLAGIVLGFSLWPLVVLLLMALFTEPEIASQYRQRYEQALSTIRQTRRDHPFAMTLGFVIPAMVEELFFRGYLFSALRARGGAAPTIVISAVLFGVFHVIIQSAPGAFSIERLLPSTLMGLVLGWLAWRSRSVIPGMLLHGIYNALLVLVGQGEIALIGEMPMLWIYAGVGGSIVGAALIALIPSRPHAD
jgi:ABC-2 type transport system permease protein/sodium transport system permease protein